MLSSTKNNYTSIDDPIKTDSSSESVESRLSRKDLCIYLIGIITGSLLIVFLFNKQIGLDYIYNNNNYYVNSNNNNHELNVESESVSTLATRTTNVYFKQLKVGDTVKFSIWDSAKVLKNRAQSNKIKIASSQDSDYVKWIVGYDDYRNAYSFQNIEQGCYMQQADGLLKCLSSGGLQNKTYWKADTNTQKHKGIRYQKLKNYGTDQCPYIDRDLNNIDYIEMSKDVCTDDEAYVDVQLYAYS